MSRHFQRRSAICNRRTTPAPADIAKRAVLNDNQGMFRLIIFALLLALVDPILLYVIYKQWGGTVLLAVIAGPWVLGGLLANLSQRQLLRDMAAHPQDAPAQLADTVLIRVGGGLTVYPGPLSSVLGLLLLLPPIRRWARGLATAYFFKSLANSGGFSVMVGGAGNDWTAPRGPDFPARGPAPGGLKSAEGRVIDDIPQLPEQPPPANPP